MGRMTPRPLSHDEFKMALSIVRHRAEYPHEPQELWDLIAEAEALIDGFDTARPAIDIINEVRAEAQKDPQLGPRVS